MARVLSASDSGATARIVTKGGMTRPDGAWVPDGRARALRQDCEASLTALGGRAIDLYLIHAPDPRTPWATTVRALARLLDEGLVGRVGVSGVNRAQLDEALAHAPVAAVQVAVSVFDDTARRSGVLDRCQELGLAVMAHSPLGGPARARRLGRHPALAEVARRREATLAEIALAWLLDLSPNLVAIPGACRPETARSAARAAQLTLDPKDRLVLSRQLGWSRPPPSPAVLSPPGGPATDQGEVVVVMGIPGAGKTRTATALAHQGYLRLNRDERGGSLPDLARTLEEAVAAGERRVVLDNTYLTRAARSHVIDAARGHQVPARCIWVDTPLDQAQVNLVTRLLDRFGRLPPPDELKALARREPGLLSPTAQMRARRQLEPPSSDEGFTAVDRVPFRRDAPPEPGPGALFVAAAALDRPGWQEALAALTARHPDAPALVFHWDPGRSAADLTPQVTKLAAVTGRQPEAVLCPHPGGPPTCWCRPPLPGLPLAFARTQGIDLSRSALVGSGAAHRNLAAALGTAYVEPAG